MREYIAFPREGRRVTVRLERCDVAALRAVKDWLVDKRLIGDFASDSKVIKFSLRLTMATLAARVRREKAKEQRLLRQTNGQGRIRKCT